MKKLYTLYYDWIGGSRLIHSYNLFDLSQHIDKLLEEPNIIHQVLLLKQGRWKRKRPCG